LIVLNAQERKPAMQHIAIDLGGQQSQTCIREQDGSVILERKVNTLGLKRFLTGRPKGRVIVETCAEAFRVADGALATGHEVRVVPATLVRQLGVGYHGVKTDQRDAQVLSEVSCRINLPSVHIPSEQARIWKSLLSTRLGLIAVRTQLTNSVRGWLRTQLIAVRGGGPTTFPERVRKKLLDKPEGMPAFIERHLSVLEKINKEIKEADAEVVAVIKDHPVCQRLMTVPGVGPITAAQFYSAIDDVSRFPSAHQLESYLGLTPGERSSSQTTRRTGITKAGSAEVRRVLNEACWCIRRQRPHDPLAIWGRQVAERRGKWAGNVAMCRKLAGILFAMWRDGTTYDANKVSRLASGTWELRRPER
jgi:transposase